LGDLQSRDLSDSFHCGAVHCCTQTWSHSISISGSAWVLGHGYLRQRARQHQPRRCRERICEAELLIERHAAGETKSKPFPEQSQHIHFLRKKKFLDFPAPGLESTL
jgi:hypothetical protein